MSWLCALAVWLAAAAPSPAASITAELSRLEGHRVEIAADRSGYRILDVAGEGEPLVGVVERRGDDLILGGLILEGPLAIARIAGPGYKIWALGVRRGDRLELTRVGVLAPPVRR